MEKTYPRLIADIGATNARFALCDEESFSMERILKCRNYAGPAEAAQAYLAQIGHGSVGTAAFAVAGPVTGDQVEITNHPWQFSIAGVRSALGLDHFTVMNDFEAIARSIPHLKPEHLRQIGNAQSRASTGPCGIIGPGTGLGVSALVASDGSWLPIASEGGHVTMPARTRREFDIFEILHAKYSHVSAERVCSGKGLVNLYNALRILSGRHGFPDLTAEQISAAAIAESCPLCIETLDLAMGFLGRIAGNLALTLGATGGIYVAGGICSQLGEAFFTSRFREEFDSKGRAGPYLKTIPAFLILHPYPALIGLQRDPA